MPYRKTGKPPGRPKKTAPPNDGQKPQLPNHQWLALICEYKGAKKTKTWHSEGWPSETPAATVAKACGKSRQSVTKWRKENLFYFRGLQWLISQKVRIGHQNGDPEQGFSINKRQRAALIGAFVKREWTGPVKSILNDRVYDEPDEYAAHLFESGVIPYEDSKALREKKRK